MLKFVKRLIKIKNLKTLCFIINYLNALHEKKEKIGKLIFNSFFVKDRTFERCTFFLGGEGNFLKIST